MFFSQITYIHEPTPLQCGQAVLAMITGRPVEEIISRSETDRETTLSDMRRVLEYYGYRMSDRRIPVQNKEDLPDVCLLSLETPRCWHWSLFANGTFFDPEHGVLSDFPASNRRYYWEIYPD